MTTRRAQHLCPRSAILIPSRVHRVAMYVASAPAARSLSSRASHHSRMTALQGYAVKMALTVRSHTTSVSGVDH
jgi:hypothetical protein